MKILALTRYEDLGASSRVRFLQYIPMLKEDGIDVKVSPLLSNQYLSSLYIQHKQSKRLVLLGCLKRFVALLTCFKYDVIWVEKELFPEIPAIAEWFLSKLGKRIVVDYDDAVFLNYRKYSFSLLKNKIAHVMKMADVVVCGNEFIADYARKNNAKQVCVIPTVVDTEKYFIKSTLSNSFPVIGWIGSPSTAKYLDLIADALIELKKQQEFTLRIVGARWECPGLNVEYIPWSEETEVECIQGFDVGIMPLHNTEWEHGKCGYKLIQYLACGVPVVASPVGVNCGIVQPKYGVLASTMQEWVDGLTTVLNKGFLKSDLNKYIENEYSVQSKVKDLKGCFEKEPQ